VQRIAPNENLHSKHTAQCPMVIAPYLMRTDPGSFSATADKRPCADCKEKLFFPQMNANTRKLLKAKNKLSTDERR